MNVTHRLPALVLVACLVCPPATPADTQAAPPVLNAGSLSALLEAQAGKVVLLNFWATWCRPCLEEIPALQTLAERYRSAGFVLVPVSLDDPDSAPDVVPPFIERWFAGFDTWLSAEADMDAIVRVVDPAWNEVLPTSYIIGRDGVVLQRLQGGKTIEEFDTAIRSALRP